MEKEKLKFYSIALTGGFGAVRCLVTDQEIIVYDPPKLLEKDKIRDTIPYYDIDSISFERYNDKFYVISGLIALGMGILFVTFILPLFISIVIIINLINLTFITIICWTLFIFLTLTFFINLYRYKKGEDTILIKTYEKNYRFTGKLAKLKVFYEELLNHIPNNSQIPNNSLT